MSVWGGRQFNYREMLFPAANNTCSYWYSHVPKSVTNCNPVGVRIGLQCAVYVPDAPSTTVKWYKSDSLPGTGTAIGVSGNSDGYEMSSIRGQNTDTSAGLLYYIHRTNFTAGYLPSFSRDYSQLIIVVFLSDH